MTLVSMQRARAVREPAYRPRVPDITGNGGNGGSVSVTDSGTITGSASGDIGVFALSAGGSSGATDNADSTLGGNADGVSVTLQNEAAITVGSQAGSNSIGVEAVSAGGLSWYGSSKNNTTSLDGDGSAVTVTLGSETSIATAGELGVGVLAASTGGNANTSETPPDSFSSDLSDGDTAPNSAPSTRAAAGNAGNVSVTASGAITTTGNVGIGIVAASTTGGTGLSNGAFEQVGTVAPGSGSPGTATVDLTTGGTISTSGIGGIGILGLSLGGPGGVIDSKPGLFNLLGDNTPGNGTNGSTVSITNDGSIATTGTVGIGIVAESIGGGGGTATGTGGLIAIGSDGGAGGNGGNVAVQGDGSIATQGIGAPDILAQSIGGGGGNGANATGFAASVGGSGGAAGNASSVNVSLFSGGALTTQGDYAPGVIAQAIGGGGGNGGYSESIATFPVSASIGGDGSGGGSAGTTEVESAATLSTAGEHSPGILAQSIGGGGGTGGQASDIAADIITITVAVGGSGGQGGNAGNAEALNTGSIETTGPDSIGILTQSVGGGGGNGGASTAKSLAFSPDPEVPAIAVGISLGGSGGASGAGQSVFVSNYGNVTTEQDGSTGILAQSIGGGGGNGGDSSATAKAIGAGDSLSASVAIGGSGSGGGNGANVTVNNGNVGTDSTFGVNGSPGTISTSGNDAAGIVAQSIGGGGGNGGIGDSSSSFKQTDANLDSGSDASGDASGDAAGDASGDASEGESESISISLGAGVGGGGGEGGSGGVVTVTNAAGSSITTQGSGSQGILGQSIGGGGGNAGGGTAASAADKVTANVAVGGEGGSGNLGGSVTVTNNGIITTAGGSSDGIAAQSIGGSGGYGGSADSKVTGKDSSSDDNSGNSSSGMADGSASSTESAVSGESEGSAENAAEADSASDEGADGSEDGSGNSSSFAVTVGVGGTGGSGSSGGTVLVTNTGQIVTGGEWSNGILAQSIGGGGGVGGGSTATAAQGTVAAAVGVGGSGGSGNDGGTVNVSNSGAIATSGAFSNGVLAQSVGGGGGESGESNASLSGTYSVGVGISLSGSSGGGNGGSVTVTDEGAITTTGEQADAILAQSIGGGGGAGGASDAGTTGGDYSASVGVGGGGGAGGTGGSVSLTIGDQSPQSGPAISTSGTEASGIVAQSIGGGGGTGGAGSTDSGSSTLNLGGGAGGKSGSSGAGGEVTVTDNAGSIQTQGDTAYGILAQSIGGGGGVAGSASSTASSGTFSGTVAVGGAAGSSGSGGTVNVTNGASIATAGDLADAVLAQSIGGGGGTGGATSNDASSLLLTVGLGGKGSGGGAGGAVTVTDTGAIVTTGNNADGIVAQSIGGGGGEGGVSGASSGSSSVNLNLGFTGGGGGGTTGGDVTVNNATTGESSSGSIETLGGTAYGILAQSIGGGGGTGGSAGGSTSDGTFTGTVTVGGTAGSAGSGGTVNVTYGGSISTAGDLADAILAQSIGGGGGAAGGAGEASGDTTVAATVTLGGGAGDGGGGGTVTVTDTGAITTTGDAASGIVAQSIGGGGGLADAGVAPTDSDSDDGADSTSGSGSLTIGTTGGGGNGVAGGNVTVSADAISTAGDDAYGILAESIGGGGGSAAVGTGFNRDGLSLSYNIGGDSGSSGNGDGVTVTANDPITTTGARSFGIVAQSIGGGGGIATASAANLASTGLADDAGANSATGGLVTVTLASTGSITTSGAGAWGILAQSIGGGGGFDGDPSLSLASLQSNTLGQSGSSNAFANTVTVSVAGNITTTGANAHGVFAQSIGGSGGIVGGGNDSTNALLLAGNAAQLRGSTNQTFSGNGGTINITQAAGSTIDTSGLGSIGIVAQSSGESSIVFPITVVTDGTVIGGTNGGAPVPSGTVGAAGIVLSGGGNTTGTPNTITVGSSGSVSTVDGINGTAILTNDGVTNVSNSGTIEGDINLGQTPGTITNTQSGTVNLGSSIIASALTNDGVVNVQSGTTNLSGTFTQGSIGTFGFIYNAGSNSTLAVAGKASLSGNIAPVVLPNSTFLPFTDIILTSAATSLGETTTPQTLLFGWNLQQAGNTITITPTQNFLHPRGADGVVTLTRDEDAVAAYLAKGFLEDDFHLASLFSDLYQLPVGGAGAFASALDARSPRATQGQPTALKDSEGSILGASLSCPIFADGTSLLTEGSCVWAKFGGQQTNQYSSGGEQGFEVTGATYRVGAQKEFLPNWFVGGSLGAGTSWANDGGGSTSLGQTFDGSLAIKHQMGPWLLAGSLAIASGSYQNNRFVNVSGVDASLQSDSSSLLVGGRLRAAYDIPLNGWYVRPYTDLDIYHINTPSFQESGPSGLALNVDSADTTNVVISPMVEIGGRYDTGWKSTVLRYYVDVGASFLPSNSRTVNASIEGALAQDGTFGTTINSPDALGDIDFGLQLYQAAGFEVKAEYGIQAGNAFFAQGGTLRLAYHF